MGSVVETPGGGTSIWIWAVIGIFTVLVIVGIYYFLLSKKKGATIKTCSSDSETVISSNQASFALSRESKIDERRIITSYIVAIFVPLFLGFWINGFGHFFVGRYKRGIIFLLGTLTLTSILAFFLVALPLVYESYTLPWAEYDEWDGAVLVGSLWPGILITMLSGFLLWIFQIIDLIRINRTLSTKHN